MSTTAVVTPYEPEQEAAVNELALREERAIAEHRREVRMNRCKQRPLPLCDHAELSVPKSSLTLNTTSLDQVQKAAMQLGYTTQQVATSRIELRHPNGSQITLNRISSGQVKLSGGQTALPVLKNIAREYTAGRVIEHLRSRNMVVDAKRTPQGEISIEAKIPSQKAVISADIRQDGIAVIDVSGIKGQGCQKIISAISDAIGGSQIDTARKNEFFVQPAAQEKRRV
jgi:hypothetical protein